MRKRKKKFKNKVSLFTYGTKSGNQMHGLKGLQESKERRKILKTYFIVAENFPNLQTSSFKKLEGP